MFVSRCIAISLALAQHFPGTNFSDSTVPHRIHLRVHLVAIKVTAH